ncbi:AAA family ATPase [Streptomyces yaizuensis]|uniref:AAA family ATPase n=1 Tax=Streptomyces yaizuensis TaxID=2989713 RepID=A0ABQ5P8J7_9ACTN|nr:AAA family ATPase [Streptomyces sp. YSPA8]GLF98813.1 AAA family ATPase [Streptomyces sp. YSPA8]
MNRADGGGGERFVGRQAELGLLLAALEGTRAGTAAKIAVTGEMGIGRTSLLRRLTAGVRARGCPSLHFAYGGCAGETLAARVGRLGSAADGSVPADRGAPDPAGCSPGAQPADGLPGMREAVAAATRRNPLLITVDDGDLMDAEACSALTALLRSCSDLPVLLVMCYQDWRPAAAGSAFTELLMDSRFLRLQGLTVSDTSLLVRKATGVGPAPGVASACHRVCAGNPLLLTELLRGPGTRSRGALDPKAIDRAVLPATMSRLMRRLAHSGPHATEVVTAAAVTGGAASPHLLAHLCDLGLTDGLRAADQLLRMRFLADDGEKLLLRHPVLRNSVLAGMTRMARDATRLKAAAYLHRTHAPVEDIAAQLAASTVPFDRPWSTAVLREAGRLAVADHREKDALRHLEQALGTAVGAERDHVLVELTELRLRTDPSGGVDSAVTAVRDAAGTSARSRLLSRLGGVLYLRTPDDRGRGTATVPGRAAAALTAIAPVDAARGTAAWAPLHRTFVNEEGLPPALVAERAERLLTMGPPADRLRPAAAALALFNRCLVGVGPAAPAEEADRLLTHDDDVCVHPLAPLAALTVLLWHGRHDLAAHHAERHENCEHGRGHTLQQALLLSVRARISLAEGKLPDAADRFARCLEELSRFGTAPHNPVRLGVVGAFADVLLDTGDEPAARELLRDHLGAGPLPTGPQYVPVLLARSRLRLAAGDPAGASHDAEEAGKRVESAGIAAGALPWRSQASALMRELGRLPLARRWAEEQVALTARAGSDRDRGEALHVLGAALGGEEGAGRLREAVTLLEGCGARLQLARALFELGSLAAGGPRWEEAGRTLGRALPLAEQCGATPLALRIRDRLASLDGESPERVALRAASRLTTRERQVLVAALRGGTNTVLATDLHITRRTVEIHLTNAYRKLGIQGRTDFGTVFRVPGLWPLLQAGAVPRPLRAGRTG